MELEKQKQKSLNNILKYKNEFKPLRRTIYYCHKNPELFEFICNQYIDIGTENEPCYLILLMVLFTYHNNNDECLELIDLVLPYSNLEFNNSTYFKNFNYNVFACLLERCNINIIMKVLPHFKTETLISINIFNSILTNNKINSYNIVDILKFITSKIPDIDFNSYYNNEEDDDDTNLFDILSYIYGKDYYSLVKYLIEEHNFDVNYDYGNSLKEFIKNINNQQLEYNFIKLFIDNGYKVKEYKFYNYYLKHKKTSSQCLNLIKPKNTECNTIYTTDKCSICYLNYKEDNLEQVAIIPCGHTICNTCLKNIHSNCPVCRVEISNKILIK